MRSYIILTGAETEILAAMWGEKSMMTYDNPSQNFSSNES